MHESIMEVSRDSYYFWISVNVFELEEIASNFGINKKEKKVSLAKKYMQSLKLTGIM